jgi:hypothetical protein
LIPEQAHNQESRPLYMKSSDYNNFELPSSYHPYSPFESTSVINSSQKVAPPYHQRVRHQTIRYPHLNKSSSTMSPLAEYVQEAKAPSSPPTLRRPLKVRQDRVNAMRDSVAQFERIMESSPVADAIEDAIAPRTRIETTDMAASPTAIMRLPKARVFPWDRENSQNCTKTCGICCDRLVDGVMLTRLPCGHEYHLYCVLPWLSKNCTCPECRYEIETENPRFEAGRKQRMKDRVAVTRSCEGAHTCFSPFDEI